MVIPGTLAFLLFRGNEYAYKVPISAANPDGVCENLFFCTDFTYPTLLFELLPTGLLGLVVAGLLAAMMSSISATFNSASTLITMDFVNKLRPNMTSKQLVRSGQISTLVLVVLASLWAPMIGKYGDLFRYLQDILGYIAPPVVSVFILGLFWKKANGTGSFVSLMVGLIMSAIWVIGITTQVDHWFFQMHFLLRTTVLFAICLITHIIVSGTTAAPSEEKLKGMIWSRKLIKEETEELADLPWYKNYRYLAVILIALTALVVGYFW
jgi:SSS family solute:Na+ symporter